MMLHDLVLNFSSYIKSGKTKVKVKESIAVEVEFSHSSSRIFSEGMVKESVTNEV